MDSAGQSVRRRGQHDRFGPVGAGCAALGLLSAWLLCGCNQEFRNPWGPQPPRATTQPVPSPINLLLPRDIHIHPLTGGPRALDAKGRVRGIEVHLTARDAYGHSTKAFGEFRFELYEHRPNATDPKGKRLAVWDVSTMAPRANRDHWDEIRRMYEFRLQWDQSAQIGARLVIVAVFSSPFTERLFAQHIFVAGE